MAPWSHLSYVLSSVNCGLATVWSRPFISAFLNSYAIFCISFRSISCPAVPKWQVHLPLLLSWIQFSGDPRVSVTFDLGSKNRGFPMSAYCQTWGRYTLKMFFSRQTYGRSPVRLPSINTFFFLSSIIKPLLPFRWSVVFCSQLKYVGLT